MSVYVMSDIHGLKDRYDEMIEKIDFKDEDVLYILGDVIDRGKSGIALLLETMNTDNIHLLMGNHEHMMLEYFHASKQIQEHHFSRLASENIIRWNHNHNSDTLKDFALLSEQKQAEVLDYVQHLPMAFQTIKVGDRVFYLAHANYTDLSDDDTITLQTCSEKGIDPISFVWNRLDASTPAPNGKTFIFGHTVTMFYQDVHPYAIWSNELPLVKASMIDMDCGCAANNESTRLACLRLDDFEVFYV